MRTIKIILEYDGARYQGWQVQAAGPTIQGTIEEKLNLLTGEQVHVAASGRTDSGVHALEQVAHFRTQSPLPVKSIRKALNSLLPRDILIKDVTEVDEGFHARKARSKVYEYRILNRELRSVFDRGYAWHVTQPLDLEGMKKATEYLIGEFDFSAFRSVGTPTQTTVRRIMRAEWKKSRNGIIRFEIEGSGFLKQMVRAIVGTLVEVGKGKRTAEDFRKVILSRERKEAGPTAPAHGLFLKKVNY